MARKVKKIPSIFLFCALLLTVGCRPEGVIPADDMEALFRSFYLADAAVELKNETDGTERNADSLQVYLPLVEQMGYTEEDFRTSLDYYLHHPNQLSAMFQRISRRLAQDAENPEAEIAREETSAEVAAEVSVGVAAEVTAGEADEAPADTLSIRPRRTRKKVNDKDLKRLEEELR